MADRLKTRINIIDIIRGLAVINMVIYHLLYSLVIVFDVNLSFFSIKKFYPYQQYIAWSFILVSGFSILLSRKPLKNNVMILGLALLVTFITHIFIPELGIYFGILHFLGSVGIVVSILEKPLKKVNPYIGLVISFLLFIFLWKNSLDILPFSEKLSEENLFLLGFPDDSFYSSDYFPIFPWIFLYLTGFFIGRLNELDLIHLENINIKSVILEKISRNSLKIYLLHQVVIFICLTFFKKIGII